MIKFHSSTDLLSIQAECIVNPANAKGWMGGWIGRYIPLKGVAEAIHYATKGKVELESKRYCQTYYPDLGDLFVTPAGSLPYKAVIHIVTVKRPGNKSSIGVVKRGLENLIDFVKKNEISTVVIPGLGTGTGKVSIWDVAKLYHEYLTSPKTTFHVIDKNKKFIDKLEATSILLKR